MTFWRTLALGLLAINLILLAMRALAPPAPDPGAGIEMPPPDPSVPGIQLVGEIPVNDRPADLQCFTIGPLATRVQQQYAVARLGPFASELRTRQTRADLDRGWWVFIGTASRDSATEVGRQLAANGVEDYYIVANRDLGDAVSLGLFESRDNARRRQARLKELGFDAQVTVRRDEVPQFWVDYRIAPDQRSPWRFILRASPGARHLEIPCFDSADPVPYNDEPEPAELSW